MSSPIDPVMDDTRFYSTAKVARMFGITTETVRDWISVGKLEGVRINGMWRIPHAAVVELANSVYGE